MTTKNRLTKLEKQAETINSESPIKDWKDFIDWCRGVLTFDAETQARLEKQFAKWIGKDEDEKPSG